MSKNKTKTPTRVIVNTTILVTLAIAFAVIAIHKAVSIDIYSGALTNARSITNQPGLCYDNIDDPDGRMTDNERICNPGTEEKATDPNTIALYLDTQIATAQDVSVYASAQAILTIGGFLSIASLAAAVIYWNHNKIK